MYLFFFSLISLPPVLYSTSFHYSPLCLLCRKFTNLPERYFGINGRGEIGRVEEQGRRRERRTSYLKRIHLVWCDGDGIREWSRQRKRDRVRERARERKRKREKGYMCSAVCTIDTNLIFFSICLANNKKKKMEYFPFLNIYNFCYKHFFRNHYFSRIK